MDSLSGMRPRRPAAQKIRRLGERNRRSLSRLNFAYRAAGHDTPDTTTPRHLIRMSMAGLRAWKFCCLAFPEYLQWHCEAAALPYRCGGSAGIDFLDRNIAPASRFIRHEDSCADTTNTLSFNNATCNFLQLTNDIQRWHSHYDDLPDRH